MSVVLRGVRPYGEDPVDLVLDEGRIADRCAPGRGVGDDIVDCDGLIALPGFVDLHTHLREPGREDAETIESGSATGSPFLIWSMTSMPSMT